MQTALAPEPAPGNPGLSGSGEITGGRICLFWRLSCYFSFYTVPRIDGSCDELPKYNIMNSTWVGLDNYERLVKDETFWKSIKNTVIFTVGTVPVNILITFVLSYFIFQMKSKWQTFFKATLYLPAVASGVTISIVWLAIFDPTDSGLLNRFLGLFGLDPVIWLGQSGTALFSLILMNWLGSHGAGIILYLAAMGGIPKSLYEAADIDHASGWTQFSKITWPL